jgi:cellobiose phosphorylase
MLPFDHSYEEGVGYQTCGEPYAMYNSYFAPETGYRAGTPGQSWRTASSSWMLKSVVEFIFGMHPEIEGLRIDPCIPLCWNECSIKKIMRDCTFDIHFTCDGEGTDVLGITVDGVAIEGNVIAPVAGKTLKVEVKLGKKA